MRRLFSFLKEKGFKFLSAALKTQARTRSLAKNNRKYVCCVIFFTSRNDD